MRVRVISGKQSIELVRIRWAQFASANVSAVYEPPQPTARAVVEIPGPSQATPFTACRASE